MTEVRETAVVLPGGVLQFEDKPRVLRYLKNMVGQTITVHMFQGMSPKSRGYYRGVVLDALSEHLGYTPEEMHEILQLKFNPVETDGYVAGGDFENLSAREWGKVLERMVRWGLSIGADIRPPTSEERKESANGPSL